MLRQQGHCTTHVMVSGSLRSAVAEAQGTAGWVIGQLISCRYLRRTTQPPGRHQALGHMQIIQEINKSTQYPSWMRLVSNNNQIGYRKQQAKRGLSNR